jgi:hypothetical protein
MSKLYIGNLPSDVRAEEVRFVVGAAASRRGSLLAASARAHPPPLRRCACRRARRCCLQVTKLFSSFGSVTAMDLKSGTDGRAAYAFLEFSQPREAEEAVRGRDGAEFGGSRLRVEFSKGNFVSSGSRGPPQRSGFRVRVSGLPQGVSWQDLKVRDCAARRGARPRPLSFHCAPLPPHIHPCARTLRAPPAMWALRTFSVTAALAFPLVRARRGACAHQRLSAAAVTCPPTRPSPPSLSLSQALSSSAAART